MTLKQSERILASCIYFIIIISVGYALNGDLDFFINTTNNYYVLFVASSLMLITGRYITEPYFTKPIDVITKTFAIILVLLSLSETQQTNFILYNELLFMNYIFLISAIILTLFNESKEFKFLRECLLFIIVEVSKPAIIFSIVYLLTLFSFFKDSSSTLIVLIALWLLLIFKEPIEWISQKIIKIFTFKSYLKKTESIGVAIGCDNPFLYQVEVNNEIHQKYNLEKGQLVYLELENSIALIGIIFNEKHLLDKKWISVYILENKDNEPLKINFKTNKLVNSKTIYSKNNQMYILEFDMLDKEIYKLIESNYMYQKKDDFIGYVSENSNINKIRFHLLLDTSNKNHLSLGEGTILETKIFKNTTLFQVLDGNTEERKLEKHDNYGFTTVIAKKIGNYNSDRNELTTVKWLPHIYSPVFLLTDEESQYDYQKFIGNLPNTNYGIPIKNYDDLITHNTAILGILGIGKSMLTFELLKKVVENTDSKIICIDITNQYSNELKNYVSETIIKDDIKKSKLDELAKESEKTGSSSNPHEWGNEAYYKNFLSEAFDWFMAEEKLRVFILNPETHKVTKARNNFNISFSDDLSVAEKTRIISEEIFKHLMKKGESKFAKCLLVYEEAHSLVPEWNSATNSGDQSASNGTAKVILQGRKYGLGSFVITQRTANISKSILNQCNTIFAMRVFDDTGKQFLENYIGSDYANTLPTLEERHAIISGKAMKLKQPIIISLNDSKYIIKKSESVIAN